MAFSSTYSVMHTINFGFEHLGQALNHSEAAVVIDGDDERTWSDLDQHEPFYFFSAPRELVVTARATFENAKVVVSQTWGLPLFSSMQVAENQSIEFSNYTSFHTKTTSGLTATIQVMDAKKDVQVQLALTCNKLTRVATCILEHQQLLASRNITVTVDSNHCMNDGAVIDVRYEDN